MFHKLGTAASASGGIRRCNQNYRISGLEPLYPTTFSFVVLLIRCCKTHGWPAKGANPLAAFVAAASVLGEPIRSRLIESIIEFGFVLPKQLYHRIIFMTI